MFFSVTEFRLLKVNAKTKVASDDLVGHANFTAGQIQCRRSLCSYQYLLVLLPSPNISLSKPILLPLCPCHPAQVQRKPELGGQKLTSNRRILQRILLFTHSYLCLERSPTSCKIEADWVHEYITSSIRDEIYWPLNPHSHIIGPFLQGAHNMPPSHVCILPSYGPTH